MFICLSLILLITLGGMPLTYLDRAEKTMMWRLAAGNIIGCSVFGTLAFVFACIFGLTTGVAIGCLLITLFPLALIARQDFRLQLSRDWQSARGKLSGASTTRFAGIAYYAFFFLLFWFFFGQSMYITPQGIFTGGSQNLGDLPYHLGAIFSFTEGNNFPPENPSYAGARFSYPFVADLITACFVRLGAEVQSAMHLQNVAWALSLLIILERFALGLTESKLAARVAPALLFFSGGLGFLWFANDYWQQSKGLFDFLWALPRDYTIGDDFRWGNSLVVLFITQRSLLLGMPLTIIVLGFLWRVFQDKSIDTGAGKIVKISDLALPFAIGLLAGALPLIHLHSLAVLFVVTAFLFFMRPALWKVWTAFGVGVSIIAIPELAWSMTDSATRATEFIGWHFGWDKRDENVAGFWIKNAGLAIPCLIGAVYLLYAQREGRSPRARKLLLFFLPFAFLFVVSNLVKLAPWEWDNIKILVYWFVASAVLIAYAIAWAWQKGGTLRAAAVIAAFMLCVSGGLDVWRTASSQSRIKVFEPDAIKVAEQIKSKTPPDAVFLNAPTYNSAVVLSGRRSYMRYSGHLSSHGIDYVPREEEVKRIYSGGGVSDILLRQSAIDYVLVSPEERNALGARDETFRKYPVIAEAGEYRVYKIR